MPKEYLFNFDYNKIKKIYADLLILFYKAPNETEKNELYRELLGLSEVAGISKKNINSLKPCTFESYLKEKNNSIYNYFKNIEPLTIELCHYWNTFLRDMLRRINYYNDKKNSSSNIKIILDNFFMELNQKGIFINDLYNSVIADGRIKVSKTIFKEQAEIFYLEKIKQFLIKIQYNKNLSNRVVSMIVHEMGHAFIASNTFNLNSTSITEKNIMTEAFPSFLEISFFDYFISNRDKKISMLINKYRDGGSIELENYYDKKANGIENDANYHYYYDSILAIYGDIIALALKEKYKGKELIKLNNFAFSPILYLQDIGLSEEALIDTAKNAKELILKGD